jgi:glycosyltransferase involved in cell wall biosynthesis
MSGNRSLLFYGELPPKAIHGIACSNMINIILLKSNFDITIIEEKSTLSDKRSFALKKVAGRLKDYCLIILKAFRKKFDFFYLTLSISFMGGLKTFFSIICFRLFNRGKVMLHIHRGDFFKWYDKNIFNRLLANLVIGLSEKIIVLSDSQKIAFNELYTKPVFVLHNTVERELDYPLREKKKSHFIYISNYFTEKGIFDLLEVVSKLLTKYPDITLNTYGAFSTAEIKERILKYNNQNIKVGGVITGEEKFAVIESADCLILPSLNEGEPLVLLEAMSVGTPVISTNVGLIPEMLGTDYPFISSPGDQASLEEKIIQFINCRELFQISKTLKERYSFVYSNKIHSLNLNAIFN